MKRLLLAGVVLAGCRTTLTPWTPPAAAPVAQVRPRGPEDCQVNDYATASEVPAGSKNLGWIKVERQASDDATIELLRRKVCEAGGDAMSQLHWLRASGASVADPPIELEGNAWATP